MNKETNESVGAPVSAADMEKVLTGPALELDVETIPADGFVVTEMTCSYRRRLAQPGGYDSAESSFTAKITLGPKADVEKAAEWLGRFVKGRVVAELRPVYNAWYKKGVADE